MIEIIPAIDIMEGKCVRLTQGDFSRKKIYSENPVEVALMFRDAGIKRLHLVDLDGAREKHIVNYSTLQKIAESTGLSIDFGGGIKSDEDLKIAFNSGASQVTAGSIAITDENKVLHWINRYGPDKIIIGADFIDGKIAIHGWEKKSQVRIYDFLQKYHVKGAVNFICTDVNRDGMLGGPAHEYYAELLNKVAGINLIASGGVSEINDIEKLERAGCYGIIIGKAFYENKITLRDIIKYNTDHSG